MKFENLGLIRPILNALEEQGYQQPTPIQEKAIPAALAGRDVLGCAQTGTGKTCGFRACPFCSGSWPPGRRQGQTPIRALILTPTRELAIQIRRELHALRQATCRLHSAVIFGGVGQTPQVEALQAGAWTCWWPPRAACWTCIGQGHVTSRQVWRSSSWTRPTGCWTWASSTMCGRSSALAARKSGRPCSSPPPCPRRSQSWSHTLLHDPVRVAVTPRCPPRWRPSAQKRLSGGAGRTKPRCCWSLLQDQSAISALVFTRTKHGADKVAGT